MSAKDSGPPFGMAEAAAELGVGAVRLREVAAEAGVPLVGRAPVLVSLRKMNALRDPLGKHPSRKDAAAMRLAVQAFKGGMGKSTLGCAPGPVIRRSAKPRLEHDGPQARRWGPAGCGERSTQG